MGNVPARAKGQTAKPGRASRQRAAPLIQRKKQAHQGGPKAKKEWFCRGRHYNSRGVLKDDAEAVRWYRLAAGQGNARAQYSLGLMYYNGRGVIKDPVLAHMWYNIGAAKGYEMAREVRDRLEKGSGRFRSEQDLTRVEIRRATELARTCMASDYQDCEP